MIALEEIIVDNEKQESPSDVLFAKQAAPYMGRLWGRPFTEKDFNNFFTNHGDEVKKLGIFPAARSRTSRAWLRGDLKKITEHIAAPQYREEIRKPRPKRRQIQPDED